MNGAASTVFPFFIYVLYMPPKRVPEVHRIDKKEVEVKEIPGKGLGVVAVVDLPRNSRLYYMGKMIDQKTFDNFQRRSELHPEKKYADYIMSTTYPGMYIDGHPRYKFSERWIAAKVNEPAPGESANMIIRYENRLPWLVSIKKIPAGQELLLHYGASYERPYKVGRRATKPGWLK